MAKTQLLHYDVFVRSEQFVSDVNTVLAAADASLAATVGQLSLIRSVQMKAAVVTAAAALDPPTADTIIGLPLLIHQDKCYIMRAPVGAALNGMILEAPTRDAAYLGESFDPANVYGVFFPGSSPPVPVGQNVGYLFSSWFDHDDDDFNKTVATFEKSSGWWIFGSATRFYWVANYKVVPTLDGSGGGGGAPITTFAARRWMNSAELPTNGHGEAVSSLVGYTRDAGRFGGMGYGFRSNSGTVQVIEQQNAVSTTLTTWERLYVRPRKFGSATVGLWRARQGATTNQGLSLNLDAFGQIAAVYHQSTSVSVPIGTIGIPLELMEWTRLDLFLDVVQGSPGRMRVHVFIDGTFAQTIQGDMTGVQANQGHVASQIGKHDSIAHDWEYDVCNWIGADHPADFDPDSPALPAECRYGSLIVNVPVSAFGPGHGAWTGDVRTLGQRAGLTTIDALTSTGSGARLEALLDIAKLNIPGAMGWVAFSVGLFSNRGSATSGQLGWDIDGAGDDLAAITQGLGTPTWQNRVYTDGALTEPYPLDTPVTLIHTKAADTSSATARILRVDVEVLGVFGPEDNPPGATGEPPAPLKGTHNAAYPLSPWANQIDGLGPYQVSTGTYVGDNLGQTLEFPLPVHFLWIRPLSGNTGGTKWFPPMFTSKRDVDLGQGTTGVAYADQDVSYSEADPDVEQQQGYRVHIAGDDTQANATGVTYWYVAVMDPAGRFWRSGAFGASPSSLPLTVPFPFEVDPFTPEWGFFWRDDLVTTATASLFAKGPGHAADEIQTMDAATPASPGVTWGAGDMVVESALVAATGVDSYPYLVVRSEDGNEDPGEAGVLKVGTYVGDGNASRTINLAPASGLRPLFAIVQPANANSYHRDPQNTTNTSQSMAGTNLTTAITGGGIDQFTVGSTLNANGIVYNYLVIMGSATAGNGGWSIDGDFNPVASDSLNPPTWDEPFQVDEDEEVPAAPVEEPDLDSTTALPDTSLFCIDFSTKAVNRALSRAGISKKVTDLATGLTEEAVQARLHLKEDVEATLRLFPWHFATAYENLVLFDGDDDTPVNQDWQYAYELPDRCIYARRLVPQDGKRRGKNPDPAPFRTGLDETAGWLLYTNAKATVDCPLQLEFTRRVGCPAYFGDALFRETLVWKLAASFAASLAKDENRAEECLKMFEFMRTKATTAAANEEQQEKGTSSPDAPWTDARGVSDDPDWLRQR